MTCLVIQRDASEARNATTSANSSGVPRRPNGVALSIVSRISRARGNLSATSLVSIAAEAVLTRMPSGAYSTAR